MFRVGRMEKVGQEHPMVAAQDAKRVRRQAPAVTWCVSVG
jgi:hypothetical protein